MDTNPRPAQPVLDRSAPLFLVALLLAVLWFQMILPKWTGGGVPPQFHEMFANTFLAQFPGTTVAFYMIAVMETVAFLLAALSLVRGEFLGQRSPVLLKWALAVSSLTFIKLGFGLRLVMDSQGGFQQYVYAVGALTLWFLVDYWDSRGGRAVTGPA
ncbi:MAG: hypothetical protein KIT11_07190 [Fimbriimonadaceae bacterium]|nr:hypothetical protein [Fimbriimonadaceae bacterium]QYK56136.1 MAG: hypothetical protein KF733_01380 [Fimbriimonadaceae bacterium]